MSPPVSTQCLPLNLFPARKQNTLAFMKRGPDPVAMEPHLPSPRDSLSLVVACKRPRLPQPLSRVSAHSHALGVSLCLPWVLGSDSQHYPQLPQRRSQQLQNWLRLAKRARLGVKPKPQTPLHPSVLGDSTRLVFWRKSARMAMSTSSASTSLL